MATLIQLPKHSYLAASRSGTWLNLVAHLDPKYGGISAVLPPLCEAVGSAGGDASLVPFCGPDERYEVAPSIPLDVFPLGMKRWLLDGELRRRLADHVVESAGIHIHGIWQEHCLFGAQAAREANKPYIISAHGMLDPWALRNKGWKKRIYSALIERRNVSGAACLHALTGAEANEYREFGACNPIAVIPNGVHVPETASAPAFFRKFPELAGKRVLLYLARLHLKKGLDLLCRAWKNAAPGEEHHLLLAGPDFEGTKHRVEQMIAELGIGRSISFAGMLKGSDKWNALAAADAFVLPSRSEGLSVSVLEAMGMGKPAIVTSRCNVPEVRTRECGWMIEPDESELTAALREYLSSNAATRRRMGSNGRRVVEQIYSWETVGRQMAATYEWLSGGSQPTDVDLRLPG
jgi:glycosyltransferase involved in cell wall biosynthesis